MIDQCELHNNMGLVYAQKSDPKTSLTYYQTALQFHAKVQSTGRALNLLPMIYSNIGYSYLFMEDWNTFMRMFEKALHHLEKLDGPDEELRGTIYLNMTIAVLSRNDLRKAEENCERASTSWHKCFRDDHTNFTKLYRVQGQVPYVGRQYENVIQFHTKVFELHAKTLLSHHIQIAETYDDLASTLGELYQTSNETDEVLQQYKTAVRLSQIKAHADLHVSSLIKIVHLYVIKEKKDLACYYALEVIEITLQAMPINSSERSILRQIFPLFCTTGKQSLSKQWVLCNMAEKLVTSSSSIRAVTMNPIFSTCMLAENMSNMAAVEQSEVQGQKSLDALFQEDSN